jgi:hypothetical protein
VSVYVGAVGVVAYTDVLSLDAAPHLESCYTRLVKCVDNAVTWPSPLAVAAGLLALAIGHGHGAGIPIPDCIVAVPYCILPHAHVMANTL